MLFEQTNLKLQVNYHMVVATLVVTSWRVVNMEKTELAKGRYVEFLKDGTSFRIGRVSKITGNIITLVLAPHGFRGKNKGKKMRLHKSEITGIVWRKKVIPWQM